MAHAGAEEAFAYVGRLSAYHHNIPEAKPTQVEGVLYQGPFKVDPSAAVTAAPTLVRAPSDSKPNAPQTGKTAAESYLPARSQPG